MNGTYRSQGKEDSVDTIWSYFNFQHNKEDFHEQPQGIRTKVAEDSLKAYSIHAQQSLFTRNNMPSCNERSSNKNYGESTEALKPRLLQGGPLTLPNTGQKLETAMLTVNNPIRYLLHILRANE